MREGPTLTEHSRLAHIADTQRGGSYGPSRFVVYLGRKWTDRDVFAHEYAHLVTKSLVAFERFGEHGSLNEHYSDVIGGALRHFMRSSNHSPALKVAVNGWEVVAEVVRRCGGVVDVSTCPDPGDREVVFTFESKWRGNTKVWVNEIFDPIGVTADECQQPDPQNEIEYLVSTPIVRSYGWVNTFYDLFPTSTGSCDLLEVGVLDDHGYGREQPMFGVMQNLWGHGNHAVLVTRLAPNNPRDYSVRHHVSVQWSDLMYSRVVWKLSRPPSLSTCAEAGMRTLPVP